MNPLTQTRNQMKLNDRELELGIAGTKNSWHQEYKDSAWIFMGGMPYQLTEGDVICMFSQYGEVVHINLIRDHTSGKSKGFGFLCYEDQRSTILAVDNLNGFKILDRMIRVDHIHQYKLPKDLEKLDQDKLKLFQEGVAPKAISEEPSSSEEDEFEVKEEKKKKKKKDKKKHKKKKKKKDKGKSESSEDSDRENQLKASKPAAETNGSARQRSPYRREGQPEERQTDRRRRERSASPKKRERSRDRKERDEVSRRERRRSRSRDRRSRSRDRRDRSRDRRSRSRDRRRDRS